MLFLIIAEDGKDKDALARRLAVRAQHMVASEAGMKRGEQLAGGALLDDNGQMNGSYLLADFPSRAALDKWLETEIYVTAGVWKDIRIIPCIVAPHFSHVFEGKAKAA